MVFDNIKLLGEKSTVIPVSPPSDEELKEASSHIEFLIKQFPGDYNVLQKDMYRFKKYMEEVGCSITVLDEGMDHVVIFVYSHISPTHALSLRYIIFRGEAEEIVIQSGNATMLFNPNPFTNYEYF